MEKQIPSQLKHLESDSENVFKLYIVIVKNKQSKKRQKQLQQPSENIFQLYCQLKTKTEKKRNKNKQLQQPINKQGMKQKYNRAVGANLA